eukprot:gnl/TRDRNA2_/TRDRNA2_59497_c0_seq2.p1 gnl/TRDRNA2_/TRDRNA2_59497_c0~~gnl/TRDRNA2_/TRDRNA2_59497_c0_seq2.p1  ORF type:complete len:152 (-),score=13.90 gnl/TRDRNA2_/TRDRNA2_59497_c0_seq2:16-471(-)
MRPVDCKARGDTEPLEPEKEDDLQPDSIDLVVFGVTIPMHKFQQQEVAVKMWTSQQDKWQHPLHEMLLPQTRHHGAGEAKGTKGISPENGCRYGRLDELETWHHQRWVLRFQSHRQRHGFAEVPCCATRVHRASGTVCAKQRDMIHDLLTG